MSTLLETSPWARELRYRDHVAGEVFFGPRAPALLAEDPAAPDARTVTTTGTRLAVLAFDAWDRADLWWVLADANDIVDPFNVPAGTELRVPSLDRVLAEVLAA